MPKIKVKCQTVQPGERPQTNGRTHTHVDATKRIIALCYAVDKNVMRYLMLSWETSRMNVCVCEGWWREEFGCCDSNNRTMYRCRLFLSPVHQSTQTWLQVSSRCVHSLFTSPFGFYFALVTTLVMEKKICPLVVHMAKTGTHIKLNTKIISVLDVKNLFSVFCWCIRSYLSFTFV